MNSNLPTFSPMFTSCTFFSPKSVHHRTSDKFHKSTFNTIICLILKTSLGVLYGETQLSNFFLLLYKFSTVLSTERKKENPRSSLLSFSANQVITFLRSTGVLKQFTISPHFRKACVMPAHCCRNIMVMDTEKRWTLRGKDFKMFQMEWRVCSLPCGAVCFCGMLLEDWGLVAGEVFNVQMLLRSWLLRDVLLL